VRRRLDAAAHDEAADGEVADLRNDGHDPALRDERFDEPLEPIL
jgi:hypothetical protein